MASLKTLKQDKNKGFTLVEILVAIAILAIILSLGIFLSFDFYKSRSLLSEKDIIISVLQKARNQSLNNINQVRHGIHFMEDSGLKYIIFECKAESPQCVKYQENSADAVIAVYYGISISEPALPFDVIFEQLSGDCLNCNLEKTITVTDGAKSYAIKINKEGGIDWNIE